MSDSKELATQDAPRNLTPQQKQKERLDKFMGALEDRQDQLGTLLSDAGVDPKRFLAVARRALSLDPDLVMKDHGHLMQAFINAATDGLLPDKRQGAIVVYAGNPAWVPMVQGLLEVAYRSGNFRSIEARVVYAGDEFDYQLGDDPWIRHKPRSRPASEPTPMIVAAYAVAKTVNGGVFREVFEGADLQKVRNVSKSQNGPWKGWSEEMSKKSALRRMWKWLPRDDRMDRVVEHDNVAYDLDAADVTPVSERKLSPGFAPKQQALSQGADPIIETPMEAVQEEPELVQDARDAEPPHQEAERRQAPTRSFPEPDPNRNPESVSQENPIEEAWRLNLGAANSWLNIKQALRTLSKGRDVTPADRLRAWHVFDDLRGAGRAKDDILSDPVLFECWLESGPSSDEIDGNLRVMENDPAFKKLDDAVKDRIRGRAQDIKDL